MVAVRYLDEIAMFFPLSFLYLCLYSLPCGFLLYVSIYSFDICLSLLPFA